MPRMTNEPVIVVVANDHRDVLEPEFRSRYDRDYRLEVAPDAAAARALVADLTAAGTPVAMVAAERRLPDADGPGFLREVRVLSPTVRRVCLVAVEDFADLDALRAHLAVNDFDTFVGIPRGPRDEEFHTAIIDLLSDWGWSVARPVTVFAEIVTDAESARVNAIRDVLGRMGMPSETVAPDSEAGLQIVELVGPGARFPLVRAMNGRIMVDPAPGEVAEFLYGTPDEIPEGTVADVLVVGAGPAGLATAVYAASEGLSTVVIESEAIGGQASTSSMIRNYLGFPRGISGMRLTQRARVQASRFGARFFSGRPVSKIENGPADQPEHHHVHVGGVPLCARTIVIATGVSYRRLGVPGLDDLVGMGVHYGAATTVAREMADRRVFVVGGGNSAGQAAVHLARFARRVTLLVRRPDVRETMSDYLVREIEANDRIDVRGSSAVVGAGGEPTLAWLDVRSTDTGRTVREPAEGVFLMLGALPHCEWLPAGVALDEHGFVLTGRDVPRGRWERDRPPAGLETSVRGVFAAGDVRSGSMKRVASASGEGASVVPLLHTHLAWLRAQEFTPLH